MACDPPPDLDLGFKSLNYYPIAYRLPPDRAPSAARQTAITDSLNTEVELAHLSALERLNKMVTAFASMMRHETRAALVGIQGLSELIRDGGLSADEIKTCADEIFGEAQRIDALIGQMFDLNRLETGQTSFRRTRIDVNSIVSEVVLRTRAGTRQLSIGLEQSSVPLFVSGDPDRLRQAIQNVFGFITGTATTGGHIAVATRPPPTEPAIGARPKRTDFINACPVARRCEGARSLAIMTAATKVSAKATPTTNFNDAATSASDVKAQATKVAR